MASMPPWFVVLTLWAGGEDIDLGSGMSAETVDIFLQFPMAPVYLARRCFLANGHGPRSMAAHFDFARMVLAMYAHVKSTHSEDELVCTSVGMLADIVLHPMGGGVHNIYRHTTCAISHASHRRR